MATNELLLVTGMSGAGRSTVANALEDLGWYVVDNLPPQMLGPITDLFRLTESKLPRLAVVIDARGGEFFDELRSAIDALREREVQLSVIYLEADDATLVRRFEQVRRPHPLQGNGTLLDGIATERQKLLWLRESADVVIDTSAINIHQLSTKITESFSPAVRGRLRITLVSFGFKYGLPGDADQVADVRFLPNPFWNESLRPFTGLDASVQEYVTNLDLAKDFISHYSEALRAVVRGYLLENKRYATFAIGCTGGKHRSVAIAEELATRLSEIPEVVVNVKHRDLGKE